MSDGEAPRLQGGASGRCRDGYRVGFDSIAGVSDRPPRLQGGASSRLARESSYNSRMEGE
jgi:hypothetical protein